MTLSFLRKFTGNPAGFISAAVVLSFIFMITTFYPIDPVSNSRPRPCEGSPAGSSYCEEQLFDDGLVRTHLYKPRSGCDDCCELMRTVLESGSETRVYLRSTNGAWLQCKDYGGMTESGHHLIDGIETNAVESLP